MARFLSAAWFAGLEFAGLAGLAEGLEAAGGDARPRRLAYGQVGAPEPPPDLVLEIAVAGAPEGELRYELVVEGDRARAVAGGAAARRPQVRLVSGYATISGIAAGHLSPLDALAAGQAKFSGDTSALFALAGGLAGLDLLPPPLRAATTF